MKFAISLAKSFGASIVASALIASAANAAPVLWNVSNVIFNDGATASGSFTYDADIDIYSGWNIAVIGGSTPALPTYTYTSASGFLGIHSATATDFVSIPVVRYIRFNFASALSNAGGATGLLPGTSFECDNCTTSRLIVHGIVTSAAVATVPEPTSWALMLAGFGAAGFMLRRRQRVNTVITFA
jgi:PEP-CTERM motif